MNIEILIFNYDIKLFVELYHICVLYESDSQAEREREREKDIDKYASGVCVCVYMCVCILYQKCKLYSIKSIAFIGWQIEPESA